MTCALCSADAPLNEFPVSGGPLGAAIQICDTCADQINGTPDANHWRCLASAMWSEEPAVQVVAARMLDKLSVESWARDLKDQLYLDDETRAWADNVEKQIHFDSNGAPLSSGDTVVLIKDLPVKGGGFTAKRGTAVHRISVVPDVPTQIEGRVEGQRIVILTEFVKKR